MKPLRFYEHFACAYGSMWLLMLVLALVTRSRVEAGIFGLVGFPVIALIYALIRKSMEKSERDYETLKATIQAEVEKIRREQATPQGQSDKPGSNKDGEGA